MAIYHFKAQGLSRSQGKAVVAAAAYRAGEKLQDQLYGKEHDYTKKSGVLFQEVLIPEGAPDWAQDREKLWNSVEFTEQRKNSLLAREYIIALPHELDQDQQIDLISDYVKENFVAQGMCADIAVHAAHKDGDERNDHAHVLTTARGMNENGWLKDKNQYWYHKNFLRDLRSNWCDLANFHLAKAGFPDRIDHRPIMDQFLDALENRDIEKAIRLNHVPHIHKGPAVTQMQRRGIETYVQDVAQPLMNIDSLIIKDAHLRIYENLIKAVSDNDSSAFQEASDLLGRMTTAAQTQILQAIEKNVNLEIQNNRSELSKEKARLERLQPRDRTSVEYKVWKKQVYEHNKRSRDIGNKVKWKKSAKYIDEISRQVFEKKHQHLSELTTRLAQATIFLEAEQANGQQRKSLRVKLSNEDEEEYEV